MSCSSCDIKCEDQTMTECSENCGWGCYIGTIGGKGNGGAACSQNCSGICVGNCMVLNQGDYGKWRGGCAVCGNVCYSSCKNICMIPVGIEGKNTGSKACIEDNGCNVQCAHKVGGSGPDGYCQGACVGFCNSTCSVVCIQSCSGAAGPAPLNCSGDPSFGIHLCQTNCTTNCWSSCTAVGCTFYCSSSACRLLCQELVEHGFASVGTGCKSCDDNCDDNSGSPIEPGEGECGTCWGTCTDSCSVEISCSHSCMNECNILCDNTCDRVCIEECSDHCTYSCQLACTGCDNYCTACDQSCQEECIVTCHGQCAACREYCSGMATSETECNKMCRACTTMCINECVNSCITWNSGGTDVVNGMERYISNATNNDWRGFSINDSPRDGMNWYGPTTDGYEATSRTWTTTRNKYPSKPTDRLPLGYGVRYDGNMPFPNNGSSDGSRADWDAAHPGEYEWYHSITTDKKDGDIDWSDDLDYDTKRKL